MQREEILLKTSRTGTTVFYFVPGITTDLAPELQEPAYVVFDNFNSPIAYGTYSGQTYPSIMQNINTYNINVPLSTVTTNFLTGYSITQTFNTVMPPAQRTIIEQRFKDNITKSITSTTKVAVGYQTYVFYNEHLIDDMFANIKLSRTYETLDTLNIYNKPIGTIPSQEATTGVLFGKLEAIQLLKTEDGNSIRIPLANVPIGIFNPSDEFPTPTSVDNNGDRFYMNLSNVTGPSGYFQPTSTTSPNPITYDEDQKFLKSNSNFLSLPDKFKYTTITNENGEFVIYNAPIGSQTIVFEVDLFKQGLSKDEIILNYFPFPPTENPNLGDLPCYVYKQVPVDIVPAWGTNQTGYTEVNIAVNLDLRKWSTYIFAPATYGNEHLESTTAKNAANTLKILMRDMTNKGFATKALEVAQIIDDLDRSEGSQYLWFDEIQNKRSRVEYSKFGCHVLKLPANLYDPNSFKTNAQGVPTTQKGVWLAAYQFRVFINATRSFRDTGARRFGQSQMQSNYGISFAPTNANIGIGNDFSGIGQFPYEKPWTIDYPTKYSIPPMPIQQRFGYLNQRTYNSGLPGGATLILEEPPYRDGDLVGNIYDAASDLSNVGGYGLQQKDGVWFGNRISFVATRTYMYKYERGVAYDEKYSNGYEPYWTGPSGTGNGPFGGYPLLPGMSSVLRGEKFQRLECGYGYFMKYRDWDSIFRWPWNTDMYITSHGGPGFYGGGTVPISDGQTSNFGYAITGHYANTWDLDDQNLALAFDRFDGTKTYVEGIDIYRIVNSGIGNIGIPQNFVIPTFMRLNIDYGTGRAEQIIVYNRGDITVKITNSYTGPCTVVESGQPVLTINPGQTFSLAPGAYFNTANSPATIAEYTATLLPGNRNFDSNSNRYNDASYSVQVKYDSSNGWTQTFFTVPAQTINSVQNWYVNTLQDGSSMGVVSAGCTDNFDYNQNSSQDYPVPDGNKNRNFYGPVITNFSCVSPYKGFYWDNNTMPNGGIIY